MPRPLSIIGRWLLSSRLVTQLFWPIAVTTPTVLLAATQLQNLPAVEAYTKGLKDYFNLHPYEALACLAWTIVLVILNWWLYPKFERFRRKTDSLNADELAEMLLYFDNVVGLKMERFIKVAARLKQSPTNGDPGKTFFEITRPDEQLRLLLNKVYLIFLTDINDRSVELRVVLAKMDGQNVEDYEIFFPENLGPVASVQTFQSANNGYRAAAEARQMVIIPDIAKECKKGNGSRYAVSAEDLYPSGSMICYPIYHRQLGFVPYVLSVKCGKKNHFTPDSRTRYEYLLRPFSHRILLEHSLNTIKEKVL